MSSTCPFLLHSLRFFFFFSFLLQDGLIETLRRTRVRFVCCFLPQHNAGLLDLNSSTPINDESLNVPLLRSQVPFSSNLAANFYGQIAVCLSRLWLLLCFTSIAIIGRLIAVINLLSCCLRIFSVTRIRNLTCHSTLPSRLPRLLTIWRICEKVRRIGIARIVFITAGWNERHCRGKTGGRPFITSHRLGKDFVSTRTQSGKSFWLHFSRS